MSERVVERMARIIDPVAFTGPLPGDRWVDGQKQDARQTAARGAAWALVEAGYGEANKGRLKDLRTLQEALGKLEEDELGSGFYDGIDAVDHVITLQIAEIERASELDELE